MHDKSAAHESRQQAALRELLQTQRIASLGTLDALGAPFVSMVPFAVEPTDAVLVIHVSLLAPHTRHLQYSPAVSLLIMQVQTPGAPVHDLPRASLQGTALRLPPDSTAWSTARQAYLARFPEAQPMTELGDFSFVSISAQQGRHVAGFGAARGLDAHDIASALRLCAHR